ncbi:MAG: hypothetical protein ACOYKZ_03580 [Chlamydiia bacterium]
MQLFGKLLFSYMILITGMTPLQARADIGPRNDESEYPQDEIDKRRSDRNESVGYAALGLVTAMVSVAKRNPKGVIASVSAASIQTAAAWEAQKDVSAMEDHNTQARARRRDRRDRERPDPFLERSMKQKQGRRTYGCRLQGKKGLKG